MRNIWRIFVRDVCHTTRNVIGIIVAMGLVIVPALYAWYNIAASWDPYGNTKALKVAVANDDDGYKSDLIPVKVNVGETVVSALRANHQLDWQFVDKDQAIDGVHSGDYYAALVIPSSFSADMMTLFSPDMKHAQLEYYLNEKVNPIAPHITDQGASTVATTIDQTFAKTLAQVALDLVSELLKFAQSPQVTEYVTNATKHVTAMSSQLKSAASQADAYGSLLAATGNVITSADRLLGSAGTSAPAARKALQQGSSGVASLKKSLAGISTTMNQSLADASGAYDDISKQLDTAFAAMGSQTTQVTGKLTALQRNVQSQADAFGTYAAALRSLADAVNVTVVKDALVKAADQAQATQTKLNQIAANIGAAAQGITDGTTSVSAARKDLDAKIAAAKQAIVDMRSTYETSLKPQLDRLSASMSDIVSQSSGIVSGLNGMASGVSAMSSDLTGSLDDVRGTLGDAAKSLNKSAAKLDNLVDKLASLATGSGSGAAGLPDLSQFASGDGESLATLLSAPVKVDRIALYPVANYGSAMTPFYTVLSIWVGSIILVAMMKVSISDREKAKILGLGETLPLGETMGVREAMIAGRAAGPGAMLDVLRKPRPESPGNARRFGLRLSQEYFGRYAIFAAFALLQGTLVCLGDMFFLGVQCEHPLQFLMVGWLCALVFSLIMYTLTVSFGDIGKAIAVVLLVMQVAGSGGTFPIQTLPPFFQATADWLLFPYGVSAMQSAMAGSFGMEYWVAMGKLALFILPALLLGLVLRKPVIRFNDWIIRNLESTKVM
ncbi:YhgE/Pip domain-containing protein [Bifidobacterium leontopitheci]|uniref:ABC-2 family transporter protein n=1 Tax=Bifidobacterium leontopitheci TaxID=2650774 RepID=A0A6I1GJE2_9BIFI|nr:YhgE/Pip domain-containing protein [Bifidobacterium leontopitheci]KAB7789519.1 ABC-2 family transporter protein [Bifidobacterium leontopitheci]